MSLNPRLVKIYKILREFGCSEVQATIIAKRAFDAMPKEAQVPSKSEINDND